jgi:hypothetical protein
MLHRVLPAVLPSPALLIAPSRLLASGSPLTLFRYSTQPSTDEIGPGPGSRSRSLDQAQAAHEASNTSGPESFPARSPDAPADPADLAANRCACSPAVALSECSRAVVDGAELAAGGLGPVRSALGHAYKQP